ncbi:SNF2 domain-containing protein [Murinocardiopsis flavida]|uniref:SNF2 domain-containing protein n=1 Tax=Murinocardiopsis flavida TaxID=645275 RepID=A0A2P8DEV7_9ACTN|nr:helicase-related protein [Murinocardiopsis flavida]PSK95717.1 SNF2 domain-containing protein [Murinocardiopsis flavida]
MAEQEHGRLAPGAQIEVRGEEWLVRSVTATAEDGDKVRATGVSEFVHGHEATFFTAIDRVVPLLPEHTELVADGSPRFRRSRLFLEAVLRKTPLPQSERRLALPDGFLLEDLPYQHRPAELALKGLRPRVLIADVVGLGKTPEIGQTLAELIRRGRGERILVVTPQHILEQFQHELWTRFAIPLIRLDSVGIQRIQQRIPAGRNPFTYYKRVIISVDTLKSAGQYRHHLENIHWDAVVIDESHNLINRGSARNQLARVLSPRTDALLLASATPHNGDKKSFAELVGLLDPAAIADPQDYSTADIEHLYIRRTKVSPEVRDQIGRKWAPRGPSLPVRCTATDAEERVFAELAGTWLAGPDRGTPVVGKERRLFPYTLLKSFLSSHRALAETATNRLKNIASKPEPGLEPERAALERLRDLAAGMTDADSAKLDALVAELQAIGVGPRSDTRVVVFSERVATLNWLKETVPARLGFTDTQAEGAALVMDGSVSDTEQQRIVERFSLADDPARLLFTGDLASEGVNLHRQCHHLVHYDIPWSLIRIEQRNGRIDRYGQRHSPEFRAMILTSAAEDAKDDTTVAEKLLAREDEVHRRTGTAETVTGTFDGKVEEERLTFALLTGDTIDEAIKTVAARSDDQLTAMMGMVGAAAVGAEAPHEYAPVPTLFGGTRAFADDAVAELYPDAETRIGLRREDTDHGTLVAFEPPRDLLQRLSALPPSYLKEQAVAQKLRLTFDKPLAQRSLDKARDSGTTLWPHISYVSDIHPFVEWLVDKLLVRFGKQQAPVLTAPVAEPVFLVQGMYSNAGGRPTVVAWMAVTGLEDGAPRVRHDMVEVLGEAGVGPSLSNDGREPGLAPLQALVPAAVAAARGHLEEQRQVWDDEVAAPLEAHLKRLRVWEQTALDLTGTTAARKEKVSATAAEQQRLVASLQTTGAPLLRVLAVLAPQDR